MEILIILIIAVLIGFWCYKIAGNKGRDKNLAFLLGFLFGIFAVIGYALTGKTLRKIAQEQKEIEEIKSKI